MKRIKTNKKQEKVPMSNSSKAILYALGALVILAILILIIVESGSSRITVRNESSKKLEYVEVYFVDTEGPVTEEIMLVENLEKADKFVFTLDKINLVGREANLEVRFKFEDYDELFIDAGYFNDEFKGRININFTDTEDDKVLLKVKASAGVLPSPHIRCEEEHIVNLAEGYVEE